MPFKAETVAAEALARAARTDSELAAATAKLNAKLAKQAQRAIRKRQEEMARNTRRWKREAATRKKHDIRRFLPFALITPSPPAKTTLPPPD